MRRESKIPAAPADGVSGSARIAPAAATVQAHEQASLKRGLKVLGTLLITLSAVTPASSVFIIAPGVLAQAGTGAFWSFLIAAVVGVFMAFVYAELSSAYPLTGGEYAIIGRALGRLPGFVTLGLILVTQLLIIAVIALGVGSYLGVLIPNLNAAWIGVLAIAIGTALSVFDIKFNAVVTGIFLGIEMLSLLVLTGLGFLHVERPFTDLLLHPQVLDSASGGLVSTPVAMIGLATSVAIFSYNGYGSAVYFGEETHDAHRGIARAILWALVITVAAELIPVTAVLLGSPDLKLLFGAPAMLEYFITARGGSMLNTVISLSIALAIFNAVIAIILLTARLLFSSGRDSAWSTGINRALTATHQRFHTPWIATIVCGVFSAAACFIDINLLFVVTGTSLVAIYALLCLAVIAGRRNGTTSHAAYRMPLFPLPPIAALIVLGYVAYQNALDPVIGRPSLFVTAGISVLAAGYYLFVLRRRGTWVLRGPDSTSTH
jgi:amino acid transporter